MLSLCNTSVCLSESMREERKTCAMISREERSETFDACRAFPARLNDAWRLDRDAEPPYQGIRPKPIRPRLHIPIGKGAYFALPPTMSLHQQRVCHR